jgi:4-amino-4-deoxy-L-arabinose transferase-like glycosyltransferase
LSALRTGVDHLTQAAVSGRGRLPGWREWLAPAAVIAAAFVFRFYRLADMPPGLHYDEAFDGLDAHALLTTPLRDWPIFFTGNFGREPLFMYLLAVAQGILGPTALALRVTTALLAALLTPALTWLAWEMAPSLRARRSRLAWWAGLAVVALLWSQVYARYVVRVGLFPLLETLCFASLWRAWRTNRLHWWALGGALAGLCFYSYLPARLLPVVLAAVALLTLWRDRPRATQRLRGLILAGALALLIVAPLAVYYVRNPLSFSTRVEQVSVLGRGVTAISENARAVLGMVLVAGDANPRYNLPGRPALDWLTAIPFLVGLAYSLWNWRRPAAFFTLCWLAVMVMPTVFSEYAPSFQRAIGALPAFGLLIALGLDRLAAWAEARIPRSRVWPAAVGWTVLGVSLILTWRAFAVWSADPALFYARCRFRQARPVAD